MRCFLAVLFLLAASPAHAQPDRFDWRGYVPLAVGNHWQYEVAEGTGDLVAHRYVEDVQIVGEQTLEGQAYFVTERRCGSTFYQDIPTHSFEPCDPEAVKTLYLRYDEVRANVVQYAEASEDAIWEMSFIAPHVAYELNMALGIISEAKKVYAWRGPNVEIGGRVTTAPVKKFGAITLGPISVRDSYAHGIGYVQGRSALDDPQVGYAIERAITFAEVDGTQYGEATPFFSSPEYWVIPDTLDWHGYYPLEVGSAWESEGYVLVAYHYNEYREIVADTLVGDHRYAVQVRRFRERDDVIGHDVSVVDTTLLRHRSDGHVVGMKPGDSEEELYSPDLNEHFNARNEAGQHLGLPGSYAFYPLSELGPTGLTTPAYKYTSFFGGPLYVHGIGPIRQVGDGAAGWYRFNYVRLGGQEYGARTFFPVATDPVEAAPEPAAALYPNPAAAVLHVRLNGARGASTVRLYDLLGREAGPPQRCGAACEIDVSGLAPGVYVARMVLGENSVVARRVVVAR